jgi:hypothetical protein
MEIGDFLAASKPRHEVEEDTPDAVVAAYKAAVKGSPREAFDVAVRAYRARHPNVSLPTIRRRVAEIICFGGAYRA